MRSRFANQAGNALVELALILCFFGLPLLAGTAYCAVLLLDDIQISNAAHTGAIYGMRSSTFASDLSGMSAAALAEAPGFGANLTVTPTSFYVCSGALDGTHYSTQAAANVACSSGSNHSLQLVQVLVTASISPPASLPGLPRKVTLNRVSVMEVEE
jgi:Flp pilus assembly protein TadG